MHVKRSELVLKVSGLWSHERDGDYFRWREKAKLQRLQAAAPLEKMGYGAVGKGKLSLVHICKP